MTLPSVIQNYKKQVTVTQLKEAYSTLGQVAQKAFADNGPAGFETGSKLNRDDVKDFFDTYWLPYFKGAQVYPERKQPNLNNNTNYYKLANGNLMSQDGVYTSNQTVYIDVNGTKPPNTFGKDVFYFNVDFENGFVRPRGYNFPKAYVDNNCKTYGATCVAKIISDGWEINYW